MGSFSSIYNNSIVLGLIAKAIVILCCFPVHECAHAWMASKLGDNTGERTGRITLNQFKHLDLWGTIMLFLLGVGYAKPVPVNANNFSKPKRDSAIVSLAGPMSNLIMAVAFLFIEHVLYAISGGSVGYGTIWSLAAYCLRYASYINFGLAVLNLIPLPPLDGYRVFLALVPDRFYYRITRIERHSVYILLGLLLVFSFMRISPVTAAAQSMFNSVDSVYSVLFKG